MSTHIHPFKPGDEARMLHWFQDLSFDGDGEGDDPIYVCTFEAGEVVKVVHSDTIALTNIIDGSNIPFVAIRGRDAKGMFRTVVLSADNLAPAAYN